MVHTQNFERRLAFLAVTVCMLTCVACQDNASSKSIVANGLPAAQKQNGALTNPNAQANSQVLAEETSSPATASDTALPRRVRYQPKPFEMPRLKNPGYVGYEQCRECHAERVAECEPTSHFQTCRIPELGRMPAAFTSPQIEDRVLRLQDTDVTFEMGFRDGKFFQTAIQGSSRVESSIDLVYGAKQESDEVYLSWHADDSMWELPVARVFAEDCWGAAGFDRMQGGDFARELTLRCFECHMTWFEHVPGTLSGYRRDELLLGVTCERCHGPGKEHVEYHREHPADQQSHAIVYPGGLERERLIEVCTQCHSNSIRHRSPALSYRPGERLEDNYRTVHPKFGEDDHVANQITDLRSSSCFQKSEMTCTTCHDPHLTDAGAHGMTFEETCTQCHQPQVCKELERVPQAVAGKCVDCHMRQYAKINVNFDLADDSYVPPLQRSQHRISVDRVATQEVLYNWYITQSAELDQTKASELKSNLLEHWFAAGRECAQQGRFTAAVAAMREILRLDPEHEDARGKLDEYAARQRAFDDMHSRAQNAMRVGSLDESIRLFTEILDIRADDSTALGRLGSLYAQRGNREKAEKYLSQVVDADPDDQYGYSMLGWLRFLDGDYAAAAEKYAQADALEPFNSKINRLLGVSLVRSNQTEKGIERLNVALQSDPRNLDAMRDLVDAYITVGRTSLALQWAEKAAQLTEHQSLRELMVLAECQVANGDKESAGDVIRLALQLAAGQVQIENDIKQWAARNSIAI